MLVILFLSFFVVDVDGIDGLWLSVLCYGQIYVVFLVGFNRVKLEPQYFVLSLVIT